MTTATTTHSHAQCDGYCPLQTAVKKLGAFLSKFDRWMKIVEHAQATGDYSDFSPRKMPSKASKHHAYDYAAVVAGHFGMAKRAESVEDLREILAAGRAAMRAK